MAILSGAQEPSQPPKPKYARAARSAGGAHGDARGSPALRTRPPGRWERDGARGRRWGLQDGARRAAGGPCPVFTGVLRGWQLTRAPWERKSARGSQRPGGCAHVTCGPRTGPPAGAAALRHGRSDLRPARDRDHFRRRGQVGRFGVATSGERAPPAGASGAASLPDRRADGRRRRARRWPRGTALAPHDKQRSLGNGARRGRGLAVSSGSSDWSGPSPPPRKGRGQLLGWCGRGRGRVPRPGWNPTCAALERGPRRAGGRRSAPGSGGPAPLCPRAQPWARSSPGARGCEGAGLTALLPAAGFVGGLPHRWAYINVDSINAPQQFLPRTAVNPCALSRCLSMGSLGSFQAPHPVREKASAGVSRSLSGWQGGRTRTGEERFWV